MRSSRWYGAFASLIGILALLSTASSSAVAQDPVGLPPPTREDSVNIFKAPGYSPCAGRNFPTIVFWGDTHVHTNNRG